MGASCGCFKEGSEEEIKIQEDNIEQQEKASRPRNPSFEQEFQDMINKLPIKESVEVFD